MMARRIRRWPLLDSSLPGIFPSSRKKTRVLPQPGIKPLSFAREITFSGSMLMISWRQTRFAHQMQRLCDCPSKWTLLSSAWAYFIYRPHRARFIPTPLWCDLSPVEWLLRKMGQNLHMQTATWLVSRTLTQAVGPWDTRLSLDDEGDYFCRVVLASNAIRFVADAKVFYRQQGSDRQSSIDRSDKKLESQFLSMQLHVDYLRSLEESERARAASLTYLQTRFGWFFEERPDLARELERLAATLGGRLETPRLPWKYLWIQKLFGWTVANQVRQHWNRCKSFVIRCWDKVLFHFEPRSVQNRTGSWSVKSA